MSELLPCPFCGGEAKIVVEDVEPQGDPWYGRKDEMFVKCGVCGCCIFDEYFHNGFYEEEIAVKTWNTRK